MQCHGTATTDAWRGVGGYGGRVEVEMATRRLARLVRQIGTEAQRTFFSLYYSVPLCLCGEGLLSSGPPLIERASGVLAVALDFDFLFAVRVLAIVAAIFFVLRNYTLALRIPALLVLISHGHFPFGDDVD